MQRVSVGGLMPAIPAPADRLRLDEVTICAASSLNIEATIKAIEASLSYIDFADAILFTDVDVSELIDRSAYRIRFVKVLKMSTAAAYSDFVLRGLVDHVETSHCLIVQWDGHVIDPSRWRSEFLDYDYVGARWPQFSDGHEVGNGGFSLRSKRLMEACRLDEFTAHHPEDLAIGRTNREFLEKRGMRFASISLADAFSAERAGDPRQSFGYHGIFLMPEIVGADRFWEIYETLDDRSILWRDLGVVIKSLRGGQKSLMRAIQLIFNRLVNTLQRGLLRSRSK